MKKEIIYLWLTHRIPRKWLYWIAIRIGAIVTTGKYSDTVVPELTFMEAVERLDKKATDSFTESQESTTLDTDGVIDKLGF